MSIVYLDINTELIVYLARKGINRQMTLFLIKTKKNHLEYCRDCVARNTAEHPTRVILEFYTSIALDLSVMTASAKYSTSLLTSKQCTIIM